VACATLGKLCQISLLPLRTEQHIIRDQYNQPSELHFDEAKNASTIRDNSEDNSRVAEDGDAPESAGTGDVIWV
jgi:hypothetical protein